MKSKNGRYKRTDSVRLSACTFHFCYVSRQIYKIRSCDSFAILENPPHIQPENSPYSRIMMLILCILSDKLTMNQSFTQFLVNLSVCLFQSVWFLWNLSACLFQSVRFLWNLSACLFQSVKASMMVSLCWRRLTLFDSNDCDSSVTWSWKINYVRNFGELK